MAINRYNSITGSSRQASPDIGFDLLRMDQKRRRDRNHKFASLAPDNAFEIRQNDRGNDLISRLLASEAGLGEFDGLTPAAMGISPQITGIPERKPNAVIAPRPSVEQIDPTQDRSSGLTYHPVDDSQQGAEPLRPEPVLPETSDTDGTSRSPGSTEMRTDESSKDGSPETPGILSQLMDDVQAATDTVTQTATFGTFDNFEGLFRALAKQAMGDKRDFSTIWSEELDRVEKRVRGGKAATFGEGLGAAISQGYSLNTVDWIDSGLFAALQQLAGDKRDFHEIYNEILDRKRKRWKAVKKAQPIATLTGELAGSLGLPGGPIVQGVRGGRVLNRVVSAPTAQAATAGFFGAEGDLSDRVTQAAAAATLTHALNRTPRAIGARLKSQQPRSSRNPDGTFGPSILEDSSPRSVVEAGQNVGVQVPATRLAFAPPVRTLGRYAERAPGLGNIVARNNQKAHQQLETALDTALQHRHFKRTRRISRDEMQAIARTALSRIRNENIDEWSDRQLVAPLLSDAGIDGDPTRLAHTIDAMSRREWRSVAALTIANMGRTADGQLDPQAFLRDYQNLSTVGRGLIFGSRGSRTYRYVRHIATVAGRMPSTDEAQRAARMRLNSARLLAPINASAMAFDPLVQMSGAFAAGRIGLSVADVLARPVTAQQAANWSRAYARFIQEPSPRTQRALGSASSAFSSKLANEFGNSGGFESVTRALMGQSDSQNPRDEMQDWEVRR